MQNKNETFIYSYSAEQQEEIKNICQKYLPLEENKMEQLRRLDKGLKRPGRIIAISWGVISSLILGTGMCCVMEWDFFVLGIIVGLIGIIGIAVTYPLYSYINNKQRRKLAPKIMELSKELLK